MWFKLTVAVCVLFKGIILIDSEAVPILTVLWQRIASNRAFFY